MKMLAHFHRLPTGPKALVGLVIFIAAAMLLGWAIGAAFDKAWVAAAVYACFGAVLFAFGSRISRDLKKEADLK